MYLAIYSVQVRKFAANIGLTNRENAYFAWFTDTDLVLTDVKIFASSSTSRGFIFNSACFFNTDEKLKVKLKRLKRRYIRT